MQQDFQNQLALELALARMGNPETVLPEEPNGLDLGWAANMRDFGSIYGPEDAPYVWRRFYGPGYPDTPDWTPDPEDFKPFLPEDGEDMWGIL